MTLTEAQIPAHTNATDPLNNYISSVDAENNAKLDFNGSQNTTKIVQFNAAYGTNTNSYAAPYCKNYVFTYPVNTRGYLPSFGQLWTLYQNKAAIDACLSACGGTAMGSNQPHWSSTPLINEDGKDLWILFWGSNPNIFHNHLSFSRYTRPICDYE